MLLPSLLLIDVKSMSPSSEVISVEVCDWSAYRHDLKRTGTYYTNKPEMTGKRILFVPTDTALYAFDGYSGVKLWEDVEDGGWVQDIICHDSMLILAKENRVVFLDAYTGRSYYSIALPNVGCLLINKGILIVVFDYNRINAYNLSDLKSPIWTKKFSCDIFNTIDEDAGSYAVTVEGDLIYVITSDFTIFILDYLTGEDIKNQKIDVGIKSDIFGGTSIAKYNDMLYIVIENSTLAQEGFYISNVLVAINLTCFKVAWTVQVASPVPPAISNDVLYITGAVKKVPNWNITGMAFDAFTGEVLWTPSAWASPSKSPVIYSDKILLVPNFAGLYAYNIKTGKELWQFPKGLNTQLSLVENTAYFGVNGTIYGLDVENNRIIFKVDVAKYIQTVIALASPSMTYTGYLSDLSAKYDESTQRMFYNWTVNIESGIGRWTTKFSLYNTVSEYWKDFQTVPAKWNITTVEIIPPGLSYQWKVELYDPEGNLVDTKWGEASSSTHTNPTISVDPEKQCGVPGSTLMYIVSITNNDPVDLGPSTFSLTYSVPSDWYASLSKTSVTLNPGETDSSITLSVTSPSTALAGDYTISVTATNVEATNYQGIAAAIYTVASFNIDILRTQFFSKIKGKIIDIRFTEITSKNPESITVTLEMNNLRAAMYTIDVYNGPIYTYQTTVFLGENGVAQLVHSIQQYDNVPGFYLELDVNVGVHVYLLGYVFDNILGCSPTQDTLWQITKTVKDKYFPEKPFLDLYDFPGGWKSWISAIANYMKENPEVFVQIAAECGVTYTINKILEKASIVLSATSSILNSVDLIIKSLTCPAEETLHIAIKSATQVTSVGSALVLQESSHKLYLHLYDSQNRHVGINQNAKEIDLEIPGTTYFDYGGRIIIILPNSTTKFKTVVDASFANETHEAYNLTIATFKSGEIVDQRVINASIKQNEKVEYQIDISSDGKLSVTPLILQPLQLYLYVGVFVIIVLIVGIAYVIKMRKKSHSTSLTSNI